MSGRRPAQDAELAMLLEVAGTPKPGNVDRQRDLEDLRFEHFLAGAVGARPGLAAAEAGDSVGTAFERAVAGMAEQEGGNTQFGTLLLLVPLIVATGFEIDGTLESDDGVPTPESVRAVVTGTTVDDTVAFYRAFDHVDVLVGDPPPDAPDLDVRRGSDAVPAVRDRGIPLVDLMDMADPEDGVAAEWVGGFERSFATADRIVSGEGTILDRTATAFLGLLADEPDTLVATKHGADVARSVSERAADLLGAPRSEVEVFADDLVERGINPGTTADVTAAGLYVALRRGVSI